MDERLIADLRSLEENHWWVRGRRRILLALLEAHLPDGVRLLDVGCGTGYLLEAATDRYVVSGIDMSARAVDYCRSRGLDGVRQGSILELRNGAGGGFDAITFFDVLEHLEDDVAALSEARKALSPDGLVFCTVPAYQWLWSPHDTGHGHYRRYTRERLRAAIRRAGLDAVRIGYFNSRLFPLAVPMRLWLKMRGRSHGAALSEPVGPLNRWMERVFSGERGRLGDSRSAGYTFGLSVFGVARRQA